MNVRTVLFATMTADDPTVLLLGAVSLAIILAALYQGGWKYVTHYTVHILLALYGLAFLWGCLLALSLFYSALFGPEEGRAGNFLGAVIATASSLVARRIVSSDNIFTRFLCLLMLDGEENEG